MTIQLGHWFGAAMLFVMALAIAATSGRAEPEARPPTPTASATPAKKETVVVGAYINDIQRIDLAKNAHLTDLYIWFRWSNKEADPSKGIDFMNWTDAIDHSNIRQFDPPKEQPDGSWYTVLHHQGQFGSKFPLQNYPFDKQTLKIEFEDSQFGVDEREFVADRAGVKLDPVLTLPGYELANPRLSVKHNFYQTNFGDTSVTGANAYSRVTIEVDAIRPWISGIFKVLLPIGLILISAILGLLVRPDLVDARIGLGITALLAVVALQFTSTTNLPEVNYLMLIDKVYIASYLTIIASLAITVRDSWRVAEVGVDVVAKRNHRALIILVCCYTLYVLYLVISAMLA